jgi:3-phytase
VLLSILVLAQILVDPLPTVECIAETSPMIFEGDAADDSAVWRNPADPGASLIIATNKKDGLVVYDLKGAPVQTLSDGRMNNVDAIELPSGASLIVATNRTDNSIWCYTVDPASRQLQRAPGGIIPTGLDEVYGLCAFSDPVTGTPFVVVGSKAGVVRIYRLDLTTPSLRASMVREFAVGGQIEGMVADTHHQALYIGEELVGLWRYSLDPAHEPQRRLVDVVAASEGGISGGLAPDVEGVTLYDAGSGEGWIVVSCQGEDRYATFDRRTLRPTGSFKLSFPRSGGKADPVTHTDGIMVLAAPLGPRYPKGIFIAQDDNDGVNQNFKVASWADIADSLNLKPPAAEVKPPKQPS